MSDEFAVDLHATRCYLANLGEDDDATIPARFVRQMVERIDAHEPHGVWTDEEIDRIHERTEELKRQRADAHAVVGLLGIGGPVYPTYRCEGGPLAGGVLADEKMGADVPVQTGADEDWRRVGFYRLTGGRWLWHPTWVEGD